MDCCPEKTGIYLASYIFHSCEHPLSKHYRDGRDPPLSYRTLFPLLLPMIRAAFVLAMITGALTQSRAMSTFYVYLIWVIVSLFFASLMFFEGEHYINPQVDTFWTALWWACMSMSTAGCNITPVTTTGTVLEVFLSAEGMMLIPVFTVYITKAVLGSAKTS